MTARDTDPLASATFPLKVDSVNCARPYAHTSSSIRRKNDDRAQLDFRATLCMYGSPQSSAFTERKIAPMLFL
jgi:hypothetical protein